jgi:hypothetical protein
MSGSIKARLARLEHELALETEEAVPEMIFVVVKNREEAALLKRVPFGIYVQGIPRNEDGRGVIAAADYLRLVSEQYGDFTE